MTLQEFILCYTILSNSCTQFYNFIFLLQPIILYMIAAISYLF